MEQPHNSHAPETPVALNTLAPLGNDYTRVALLIGAFMVATGCMFMWQSVTFSFSITALVWGSIIVCVSLFFRHKAMDQHARHREAMLQYEIERMQRIHSQAVLQHVLEHGLPAGLSWEQLQGVWDDGSQRETAEKIAEPS